MGILLYYRCLGMTFRWQLVIFYPIGGNSALLLLHYGDIPHSPE
jgi:hypothetical protein